MRRAACMALLCVASIVALLGASGDGKGDRYTVDAIFDNAAFLIPGQDVKVAGAIVGEVSDVTLTKDRKARVRMEIEPGYAPFRGDAECTIRPQSLIGEKFVQCTPGTTRAGPLRGDPPAVRRTHSPVDLDLIFAALRRPYRERLAIIVNELGTGLAGRGADLNEAILRANPALQETRELLAILDEDRETLGRLVERSDRVLEEVASRSDRVQGFIEGARATTASAASRREELDAAVRRLPPLLRELEPSANSLADFSRDATPVMRDLHEAAPSLRALLADLAPLTAAARPTLAELGRTARIGRGAVSAARPVARRLRPVASRLVPVSELGADLNESLRDRGVVEGLERFVYFGTSTLARFDRISHIAPSYLVAGPCQEYAREPREGCSARWQGGPRAARAGRSAALDYLLGP